MSQVTFCPEYAASRPMRQVMVLSATAMASLM